MFIITAMVLCWCGWGCGGDGGDENPIIIDPVIVLHGVVRDSVSGVGIDDVEISFHSRADVPDEIYHRVGETGPDGSFEFGLFGDVRGSARFARTGYRTKKVNLPGAVAPEGAGVYSVDVQLVRNE